MRPEDVIRDPGKSPAPHDRRRRASSCRTDGIAHAAVHGRDILEDDITGVPRLHHTDAAACDAL